MTSAANQDIAASDILGRMLMVIFGAGASFDSSPDYPAVAAGTDGLHWRPPLANNLFDNPLRTFSHIVQRYPKLPHVLTFLRQRSAEPRDGQKSVEEVLELLQRESVADASGERRRDLATVQYYLRDLLFDVTTNWTNQTDGNTNYALLVADINLTKAGEPVLLVTFNYDLLLDRALQSINGYGWREPGEQFEAHPTLKLFKPHGSADWARVVQTEIHLPPPHVIIENFPHMRITNEFKRIAHYSDSDKGSYGKTLFPAIAIPVQHKTDDFFACPPNHLSKLQELLPNVTRILVIGWQAREAHFIQLLKGNLPDVGHLMVVGGDANNAFETLKRFATNTRLAESTTIDSDDSFRRGFRNFTAPRLDDSLPRVAQIQLSVAPGGFTEFARNRRVIEFLNA